MKKPVYIVFAAALFFVLSLVPVSAKDAGTPGLKSVSQFENGRLYSAGKFKVVELTGSYRQMGRQYGALLKDDLTFMHRTIGSVFVEKGKMSPDLLARIAKGVFDRYPQRYKEILYGMADTSGLPIETIQLINAVEWFPKIDKLDFGRCSGIAAWGPYTGKGPVVFGRNNDDDPLYLNFSKMVVAVFKPNDGSIPTALINYAGVIYNATGMNAQGLFVELNAGPWLGFSLDRVSVFTTLFLYLQEYGDLGEFDRAMRSTLADLSSIITVADRKRAYSYECSLWDTKRRDQDADGIIAVANAFSLPDWNLSPVDPKKDPGANTIRTTNLLKLAAKYKGAVDPAVMMKILDVPLKEGGATHKGTIYQVVAVPERSTIWLKVPGLQDWTEIPLKGVFGK